VRPKSLEEGLGRGTGLRPSRLSKFSKSQSHPRLPGGVAAKRAHLAAAALYGVSFLVASRAGLRAAEGADVMGWSTGAAIGGLFGIVIGLALIGLASSYSASGMLLTVGIAIILGLTLSVGGAVIGKSMRP
jgi:hypothetical protein